MKAVFTLLAFFVSSLVFANNIQLQKVSLSDTNRTAKTVNIKFNVSWEHSWRDSINWDAAWIMIKYKEPKDSLWKWRHAMLVQSGNSIGTATGVKIVVPDDRMGAFFYRSQIGEGTISSENVKLVWNYGAAGVTNIDSVEVRVFATEMVYVPQGNYCLGDGNGTERSPSSFQLKNAPNNYSVINERWSPLINTSAPSDYDNIGDDKSTATNGIRISGLQGLDTTNDKIADSPDFPTGYRAFYCMKYKVTQGQYTDFLNTPFANDTASSAIDSYLYQTNPYQGPQYKLLAKELKAYWRTIGDDMYSGFSNPQRNTIFFDSIQSKFTVSRPDRVYGRMTVDKSASFAEWFGMRPMSELEFEKACRGPLPPAFSNPYRMDRAWGDESQYPPGTVVGSLTLSPIENGTETFEDYDVSKRNLDPIGTNYDPNGRGANGGDGGNGPYRVGIYATETSTRISSGASYYGIMDLNKIASEIVITVSSSTSRSFSYLLQGKGVLSAFGQNYSFANVTNSYTRDTYYRGTNVSSRGRNQALFPTGFRAVRSAPSDN